jgi:signal transduction histidine kinase
MRAMAQKHEIEFRLGTQDQIILADPDRMVQCLTNLMSNAIKFSDPGTVVKIGARKTGLYAWFEVSDEGRGIPAAMQESIFERFHQVDATDSRNKGGTGLGLAICRTIVQQHGGKIWVESQVGKGSTFFFTVPLAESAEAPPSRAEAENADVPLSTGD